jgi:hypothetical protein
MPPRVARESRDGSRGPAWSRRRAGLGHRGVRGRPWRPPGTYPLLSWQGRHSPAILESDSGNTRSGDHPEWSRARCPWAARSPSTAGRKLSQLTLPGRGTLRASVRLVRARTSKGPSAWNHAAATARARPHSRAKLYPFRSDQGTAPQLSTYEHRLGVAISAASAIISVGATRGPVHGHPRWTLIGPVASRCRMINFCDDGGTMSATSSTRNRRFLWQLSFSTQPQPYDTSPFRPSPHTFSCQRSLLRVE